MREAQEVPKTQEAPAGNRRASVRKRLATGLLSLSLAANAFLVAALVADMRTSRTDASLLQPPTTASETSTSTVARRSSSPAKTAMPGPTPVGASHGERGAGVERKILALVVRSPDRLPPALIDRSTGLPENNLQATCRASSGRSFMCIVRPTRHRPKEGLRVRYRPGRQGHGVFTWYPYRHG